MPWRKRKLYFVAVVLLLGVLWSGVQWDRLREFLAGNWSLLIYFVALIVFVLERERLPTQFRNYLGKLFH